ncbi:rod shape determining protein RodA [Haloferula luteola]|uniref:Rod shape determining protein RodA n=1 Tax=Haloferula luteola TaxID=595692 RepID=A0A840V6X9_9BACT|nr:FtsW/RodA/SpoVE family cell cycle protein [Haloferula luteola]MBB5350508.1 rod shape determining protein RodA [Haloferula luteola]
MRDGRRRMTPLLRKLLGMNWWLVIVMFGLLATGVFAIESAARHLPEGGHYYANLQKKWILLGSGVYFATALFDYRWFRWLALPIYGVALVLCGMIMNSASDVHQFTIGGVSFQPAQLAIASGILMLGWLLQDLPRLGRKIPKIGWLLDEPITKIILVGAITGIPFLLVVKMGDMGSALVWLPVALVAMVVGGVPFRYLSFLLLVGAAAIPPLYYVILPQVSDRGTERIELFLDLLAERPVDISDTAWAPYNIAIAVGHAGWNGTGFMANADQGSIHDRRMIPFKTAHNDFVFPVFAEEMGFKGGLLLISGFTVLLVLCLFVASYARDPMGCMLVGGVVALFFAHVFENIGMCIQLMPITGIPLPLISYSGTFVLMCMFLLGLVQSVWVHRKPIKAAVEMDPKKDAQEPGLILSSDLR